LEVVAVAAVLTREVTAQREYFVDYYFSFLNCCGFGD